MKVQITFKDPDGVYECVREAVEAEIPDGLSKDEQDDLIDSRMAAAFEALGRWIRYKEYLAVELDTDSGEAKVLTVK